MTEETLEKAVDALFEKVSDITIYTSITAKDVILKANKLKMTPTEYLTIVSRYIQDFEKAKEGYNNENI